jgi:type I site-specific restriction endonuclease
LLLLAFLVTPALLEAQQQPSMMDQLPPEAQQILTEVQRVQSELQPIQEEALADPELQAEQANIGARLQVAMAEVNPAVPERISRLETLMQEARTAQEEQDETRMQEIVGEAQTIEAELQQAQMEAVRRPDIQPQVQAFEARVQERMEEIDPAAAELIARLQELDARLKAMLTPVQ